MSKLRCHISVSLDGFVAGPNQSAENPLGEGGERLRAVGGVLSYRCAVLSGECRHPESLFREVVATAPTARRALADAPLAVRAGLLPHPDEA